MLWYWRDRSHLALIVSKHVIEGISELISDLLDLDLLSVDLILDVVNPLVELGDVHLSVLEPSLSELVLALDAEDLVLQLLLSLNSLATEEEGQGSFKTCRASTRPLRPYSSTAR